MTGGRGQGGHPLFRALGVHVENPGRTGEMPMLPSHLDLFHFAHFSLPKVLLHISSVSFLIVPEMVLHSTPVFLTVSFFHMSFVINFPTLICVNRPFQDEKENCNRYHIESPPGYHSKHFI